MANGILLLSICLISNFAFMKFKIVKVSSIIDPDIIVLGGGVGNIDTLYPIGKQKAEKYVFNIGMKTKFIKPKLGDSAGVFGAALLTI